MAAHASPDSGALRLVVPYARPEKWSLLLGAGAATSEIALRLAEPWPLALVVDHALGDRPLTGPAEILSGLGGVGLLVVAGLATLAITTAGAVLDTVSNSMVQRAAERIGGTLRAAVFQHVL